jgi:ribosome-binding factor A
MTRVRPPSQRTNRISEEIRNHLAFEFASGRISDPRLRMLTFTRARVTRDLQQADVWYSLMGSDHEKAAAAKALAGAAGHLRSSLGQALKLRFTPVLRFHFDDGIEASDHMARILSSLVDPMTSVTSNAPASRVES